MRGWSSLGVVAAIVPWNFPLMLLSWKVSLLFVYPLNQTSIGLSSISYG